MKKIDAKLFTTLRQDGRIPLTQLSRKTGFPVSTLHERLKQHVKQGNLRPSVLVNFQHLGYNTRAQVLLSVEPQDKDTLFEYMRKHQNVNSLYRINNGWNILAECVFRNMHEMENFLENLESKHKIKQKQVHYILDEIKREDFLTKPDYLDVKL